MVLWIYGKIIRCFDSGGGYCSSRAPPAANLSRKRWPWGRTRAASAPRIYAHASFTFRPPLLHQRNVTAQRTLVFLAPAAVLFKIDGHVAVVHRRRFRLAAAIIGLLHPAIQSFAHLD